MIATFVATGIMNGLVSSMFYKYFKGVYWLICALISNSAYPSVLLAIQFVIHEFLAADGSTFTVTFKTVITVVALWLGVQVPLTLLGSFVGFKLESPKNPSKYYAIQQPIPPQPWYLETYNACLLGGLFCFASVGAEIAFVMQLVWTNSFTSFFVYLFFSICLMLVICAEVSMIFTYLSLVKGNHRWWWKAFLIPFSSGIYLMIYSL